LISKTPVGADARAIAPVSGSGAPTWAAARCGVVCDVWTGSVTRSLSGQHRDLVEHRLNAFDDPNGVYDVTLGEIGLVEQELDPRGQLG
jgi:hypothetical protein